jgi:hypothetical protein
VSAWICGKIIFFACLAEALAKAGAFELSPVLSLSKGPFVIELFLFPYSH